VGRVPARTAQTQAPGRGVRPGRAPHDVEDNE